MIAVWLVGPPRRVTRARTSEGSSPAVSAGARSSAHRMTGESGLGTPGSGRPMSSASTRLRMSRRSVVRSAIRPPSFSNWVTNCSIASVVAVSALAPALMSLVAALSHPRSRASAAVAPSTSVATPVAALARSVKRPATVSAAALKRSTSSGRSSSARLPLTGGGTGAGLVQAVGAYTKPATTPVPRRVTGCMGPPRERFPPSSPDIFGKSTDMAWFPVGSCPK